MENNQNSGNSNNSGSSGNRNSGNRNSGNRNKNRNRNRNNRKRRPNQEQGEKQGQSQNQKKADSKDRNQNSNRQRSNQKKSNRTQGNKRPQRSGQRKSRNYSQRMKRLRNRPLSPEDKFLRSYETVYNAHEKAKHDYFAKFHRVDWRRRRKLELKFFETIEKLRKFEDELEPWQSDLVYNKKWKNYRLDTTYSKNHNLEGPEEPPKEEDISDPMILQSQMLRNDFSEDTEESEGTLEDYERYKAAKAAQL